MLYIVGVVSLLALLTLSQGYANAGASNASSIQISGTLILAVKDWAGQLGVIAFTLGGLMYYYRIFSIETDPAMVIRLGHSGSCLIACSRLVNHIWPDNSFFDGLHFNATSNRLAGNGSGGLADRERVSSICSRFRDSEDSDERGLQCGINKQNRGEGGLKTLPLLAPFHGIAHVMINRDTMHHKVKATMLKAGSTILSIWSGINFLLAALHIQRHF